MSFPKSVSPEKGKLSTGCTVGLFVLVIAAVQVVVFAFHLMKAIQNRAYEVRAQSDMRYLIDAIQSFERDYEQYPSGRSESVVTANSGLMTPLLGEGEQNPREIAYITPPDDRHCEGGWPADATGSYSFVDPWGQPYSVVMDIDRSGGIINPEHPKLMLSQKVIAWSSGEDGNPDTWQDNIKSWDVKPD